MSLADLQAFITERLQIMDETLDVSPGSPADVRVIQPLLRRLGTDPFTVDIGTFLQERINQEFPDAATKEGDAITDLLIKMGVLLWNPIVREIQRVRNALSFRDAAILTTDEAEALGANLFATRNRGDFARGRARLYFAQPQVVDISPANFLTTKRGLHFFPTEIQSIRVQEMLFNVEGSLYYFDINVIAEQPGDPYNIGPDELVTIANVSSAVRVTNKVRFRFGAPEENAAQFLDRAEQELSERSLVTLRGITAKVTQTFPEVTRLNVVGFRDPEMQRDVITGGGLGALLAGGLRAAVLPDGEQQATSRRVRIGDPVDFTALVGPTGTLISDFTLTLFDAFPPQAVPVVRDLTVRAVVDGRTLEVNEQVLQLGAANKAWSLRKQELSLSDIPGGIVFPDRPDGTLSLPSNQVHIGGATDIFVRGVDVDAATLVLTSIADESPLLQGQRLQVISPSSVALGDVRLGVDYAPGDGTYRALGEAPTAGTSLEILDAPIAGSYRIAQVQQAPGAAPILTVTPPLLSVPGTFRWRLLDVLDIDLVEPKEIRIAGTDLVSVQGVDSFDTASGLDFSAYGVTTGDVVRVRTGPIAGDYIVKQVLAPLFRRIQVDQPLPATVSNLAFTIFRPNPEGGVTLPFVRIDTIDLLDSSAQPLGSTIPYALPVDVQSRAFANVAHGIKADVTDARLGIVGLPLGAGANVNGLTLSIRWAGFAGFVVTFSGGNPLPVGTIAQQINQQLLVATGLDGLAVVADVDRLGLVPIAPGLVVDAGTALPILFGAAPSYAARDIRSDTIARIGGFGALSPALDSIFDVAQVLDGLQIGFYGALHLTADGALRTERDFAPEIRRHVQVGARSIGSVRTYYLEPTSIEFPKSATFTLTGSDGAILRFRPDPTRNYQRIPALPSGVKPKDGMTTTGTFALTSNSVDFVAKGIQAGDLLSIDYVPIVGAAALPDPVAALNTASLVLSIQGGSDKTILFIHDDVTIPAGDVTRKGVAEQINRAVGQVIARINSANRLELEADLSIIVRPTGTANPILGFPSTAGGEVTNDSPHKGEYAIAAVSPSQLTVTTAFPLGGTITRQQFRVFRSGLQRICATDMAKQQTSAKLYYFDVELVSEGTGDGYNIDADQPMTVTGFRSDGYFLTTRDPNLSFSAAEKPMLHLSRSILEVGVSDDPDNATALSGQNIQIHYERSSLTGNVQNFAMAETERVVNESPLARHLIPYFVRFDLTYVGGSKEADVVADLEQHIRDLFPEDSLDVSDLEKIVSNRGAASIANPIDLVAVVHRFDRSVSVERSRDRLNTGRLAAFVPDVLNVKRRLT
jgi:hypothetical protein